MDYEYQYLYTNSFTELVEKNENIYDIKFSDFSNWEEYENTLYNYGFKIASKDIVNNGIFEIVYIRLEKL